MHGLGNDFVVIDAIRRNPGIELNERQIRFLADRHFGVGCDQVLVVEKPTLPSVDFRYRIFNADGGEVEQCGNGARCFVRFVHEQGLTAQRAIRVETANGLIAPRLEANGEVGVDMGQPRFIPAEIPFIPPDGGNDPAVLLYTLPLDNFPAVEVAVVSMGNPHAVQVVPDVDIAPVSRDGPQIEGHPRFPKRVNAGFMEVVDRHAIRLRVYERGSGETLACGTGACAAVVAGIRRGLLDTPVRVSTRGGDLHIAWDGPSHAVSMTGPAVTVFHAEIELPA